MFGYSYNRNVNIKLIYLKFQYFIYIIYNNIFAYIILIIKYKIGLIIIVIQTMMLILY